MINITQTHSSDSPKADCIFGESGTGKTTQIGRMARFVYRKTGKVTRLITADSGGYKAIENYVNVGIIQPFSLLDEKVIEPMSALTKLVQGYWPFDPETGEPLLRTIKAPNSPLDGKVVYDFTNVKAKPTKEIWLKVGGLAIEGLHSISKFVEDYLCTHPDILGELAGGVGQKQGSTSQLKEGNMVYVQLGKAGYGAVQKLMFDLVRQSCDLPVEKTLWTSLPKQYTETDKDGNVIATEHWYPSMTGKAGLRATPSWFGMLLALEIVQIGVDKEERPDLKAGTNAALIGTTKTEVRAYLKDHVSPRDKAIWKAKSRIALETAHEMPLSFKVTLAPAAPGEVHDLESLYDLEDRLQSKATDEAGAFKLKADASRSGVAA